MVSVGGGIRRFAVAALAAATAGFPAGYAGKPRDTVPNRNEHHADREDLHLGRWAYARKGKRTAAQIKRAARKKRNRARHK